MTGSNPYFIPSAPLEDDALDAVLQAMVVGITGLSGDLVRSQWQVVSPKQPERYTNWCAIGVLTSTPDDNPWFNICRVHLSMIKQEIFYRNMRNLK